MKPLTPRWKTTNPGGYFHAEVLQTCDHVTFIEGPFDALALIAGGILDALATCGTSLEASAIPVRICDATLAYDGDEKGKKAATDLYKVLRRKGITSRVVTPPIDDGRGKDWSERYRLHGKDGLAPLFDIEQSPESVISGQNGTLPSLDTCHECGAASWVITDEQRAYCKACWRKLGNEPAPDEACCQCGDFSDCLDEELLEQTGESRSYCTDCWAKHNSQVKLRLVAQSQEQTLDARIAAFTSRPCASCGGYEYTFLEDGSLICPCYFVKLEESMKPRPLPATIDLSEASRGLASTCSKCWNAARWYGAGGEAFCQQCWVSGGHLQWYHQRTDQQEEIKHHGHSDLPCSA